MGGEAVTRRGAGGQGQQAVREAGGSGWRMWGGHAVGGARGPTAPAEPGVGRRPRREAGGAVLGGDRSHGRACAGERQRGVGGRARRGGGGSQRRAREARPRATSARAGEVGAGDPPVGPGHRSGRRRAPAKADRGAGRGKRGACMRGEHASGMNGAVIAGGTECGTERRGGAHKGE